MPFFPSSLPPSILSAWRGQLTATGKQLGLRTYLLHHHQELLPRFAAIYRQLRTLPRRLRKAIQRQWGLSLAGVALLLTIQPCGGHAANFTAGTAAELVTAITTANSNGEADTITLTKDITLDAGIPGASPYGASAFLVSSAITIAGNGHAIRRTGPNSFRLFVITPTGNFKIQDTTLSGGRIGGRKFFYELGGAIYNHGQLTLEGCTVSGNMADLGGGILSHGTAVLINSTVSGNTARLNGGGVSSLGGLLTFINCTVSGNTAGGSGGGVSGTGELTNCTISGNTAGIDGGGVEGTKLTNCTISGNTAGFDGGGVAAGAGFYNTAVLTNSTVSDNIAGGSGGGVILRSDYGGTVGLTNCTVSGNTADGPGGGVVARTFYGTAVLTNSTVSGNTAGDSGGGVVLDAGPKSVVILTSSTVSDNTAGRNGGGVYSNVYEGGFVFGPGTEKLSRTLISGNRASSDAEMFRTNTRGVFSATLNLLGHSGLTTTQALSGFPAVGNNILATSDGNKPTALVAILDTTLRDNGGPTLTQNLVAGSPAIDAARATCDLTTDQRGAPRPVDGNGDSVAACDIGAVEFGAFSSALDCSTVTASVNFPRLGNRHRYPVTIGGVAAPPGDTVSLTINSIFQDEPVTSPTGQTCPDGVGVGTDVAKVRNERIITSAGDGRVYHISFTATDGAGDSCTGEVQVCVPAKEGEACGDQGALFDSTVCP